MKKILALIMVVAMVATSLVMVVPSSAEEAETSNYFKDSIVVPMAKDVSEAAVTEADGKVTVDLGADKSLTWTRSKDKLEDLEQKTFVDPGAGWNTVTYAQINCGRTPSFTFTVPVDGTYTFSIGYSAKADKARAYTYSVDGATPVEKAALDTMGDGDDAWNHRATDTLGDVELTAGEHTIVIAGVEGKSGINVIDITYVTKGVDAPKNAEIAHYTFNSCVVDEGLTVKGDGDVVLKDGKLSFVNTPADGETAAKNAWLESDVDLRGLDAITVLMEIEVPESGVTKTNWLFDISSQAKHNDGEYYLAGILFGNNWFNGQAFHGNQSLAWGHTEVNTMDIPAENGVRTMKLAIVYTADGQNLLYWNDNATGHGGKLFGVETIPLFRILGNDPVLRIGRANFGDGEFADEITINEVVVYNYALSGEEAVAVTTTENPTGDMHKISEEWSSDENVHYHECEVCGKHFDEAEHVSDGNKDCDKETLCTVCDRVLKEAGTHIVDEWEDAGNGLHKGVCTSCEAEVTAPHTAAKRTDCTEDVVCKDCGAVITEGCADHAWTEWEDDGEGHHVRKCQNEWCTGEESEAHTYTDEMNVCPKCGAKNPDYKTPADPTPADPKPGDQKPDDQKPADQPNPPKTGDNGIAIFIALAAVSAASIGVTAVISEKKRH